MGQKGGSRATKRQAVLVEASKPPVFISFLRKFDGKPGSGAEKFLLFRLTNNTRWPIILQMSGGYLETVDVGLYYLTEDVKSGEHRAGSLSCHVCAFNPLGSGKSLTFAVPLEDACNDAKMTIEFQYEWEARFGSVVDGSETSHSSIFFFNSIPESVLPLLKESDKRFTYQQNLCYVQ
jgi:hypothetical protein